MKCEKLEVWKISARLSADVYKAFSNLKDYGFIGNNNELNDKTLL